MTHMSLTVCAIVLTPDATGGSLLAYGLAVAAASWILFAALSVSGEAHSSRRLFPHGPSSDGGRSWRRPSRRC